MKFFDGCLKIGWIFGSEIIYLKVVSKTGSWVIRPTVFQSFWLSEPDDKIFSKNYLRVEMLNWDLDSSLDLFFRIKTM